jgi:hypothetical protein
VSDSKNRLACIMWPTPSTSALLAALVLAGLCDAAPPADFTANPRVGPGGTSYKDSAHFRIYNPPNDTLTNAAINSLESAYQCFVTDLGWRSPGLSFTQGTDDGPFYKMNVYRVDSLPGAAANTPTDLTLGLAWLNVVTQYMLEPAVTVHEFGHALTYSAKWWIDQGRTGAWWETIANFVADTYVTSKLCANARTKFSQSEKDSLINLKKVIGDSHQVIVDGTRNTGNYYEAWPFFSYLYNNPDNYTGMGLSIFPGIWTKYKRDSNETPLHVLDRLAAPTRIQEVVGRYWARMAFVDIGHEKARRMFESQRKNLNYANLDSLGSGKYRVKTARQPRYMGANIIPIKGTGAITATVTATAPFTATLAIRSASGAVQYLVLANGTGNTTVASGEEATLVVVNTPSTLYLYDPFSLSSEASRGLDYQLQLTGATA